jgi:hypothetical protein
VNGIQKHVDWYEQIVYLFAALLNWFHFKRLLLPATGFDLPEIISVSDLWLIANSN